VNPGHDSLLHPGGCGSGSRLDSGDLVPARLASDSSGWGEGCSFSCRRCDIETNGHDPLSTPSRNATGYRAIELAAIPACRVEAWCLNDEHGPLLTPKKGPITLPDGLNRKQATEVQPIVVVGQRRRPGLVGELVGRAVQPLPGGREHADGRSCVRRATRIQPAIDSAGIRSRNDAPSATSGSHRRSPPRLRLNRRERARPSPTPGACPAASSAGLPNGEGSLPRAHVVLCKRDVNRVRMSDPGRTTGSRFTRIACRSSVHRKWLMARFSGQASQKESRA
jgi:hypothetical protein